MRVLLWVLFAIVCSVYALRLDQGPLPDEELTITPFGWISKRCVRNVPNGAHIEELDGGIVKVHISGETLERIIPNDCPTQRLLQRNNAKRQDYDGWLAYTTFNYAPGFDAFLGYFTVPTNPQNTPSVLYLFTGLQNVDWIPIIDPEPKIFDIIQPVLQFPSDNSDSDWSVKSWYVTLDSGVLVSDEIVVDAGDNIFGNMTRTSGSTWYIGGTSSQTGQTTGLTVTKNRLLLQPWAYNTAEGYGVGDCTYEPTNACVFTKIQLFSQGKQILPVWVPHQSPTPKCNEKATVNSPNAVTITFQ